MRHDVHIDKAMDYMLKRRPASTRFLDDGRICLSNKAAERALRGIALGRRAWLFAVPIAAASVQPQSIADCHCQTQRRRSPSLARRCAAPHRLSSGFPAQ